jgi:peptidoglycan lytic transglycosylase G
MPPGSQSGRWTQPPARPGAAQSWRPGPPVQASHDPGDRYEERGQYDEPGSHPGPPEYPEYAEPDPYSGDGENEGRFLPGFGDSGNDDEYGDADYEEYPEERPSRRSRRDDGRPPRDGGRRRRRFRWIAPLVALLVIVVPLAVGGVYGYNLYMDKYHPADYSGAGTGNLVVQVATGDSASSLAPKLVKLGVVASSRAFVLAAEHSASGAGLLPGFYGVHKHMKASLAYAILVNPANMVQVKVTIPEGWRLSQITAYLGAHSGIAASAYAKALKDPATFGLPSFANGKPEGYLFPATYAVIPHETATGVLKAMVKRFGQESDTVNLVTGSEHVKLTPGQVVTMASLVQAEGGRLSDYRNIAEVIYNRLRQGIPLELDSTVLYGLNTFGIIASNTQLQSPSPYNTYKHKGLPPGPIDSPGAAAIQAVLHPATGNYLYFVTVNPKTGETKFTSNQQQFQEFRQELEHNLAKK